MRKRRKQQKQQDYKLDHDYVLDELLKAENHKILSDIRIRIYY